MKFNQNGRVNLRSQKCYGYAQLGYFHCLAIFSKNVMARGRIDMIPMPNQSIVILYLTYILKNLFVGKIWKASNAFSFMLIYFNFDAQSSVGNTIIH